MTYRLPKGISFVESALPALKVDTAAGQGLVYLQGAHVAEWIPAGHTPVLWLSELSEYVPGKPIRGGIPVCFPWFGTGEKGDLQPQHGFARLVPWQLVDAHVASDGTATIELELLGDDCTDQQHADIFPPGSIARLRVSFGAELDVELSVTAGDQPLHIEEAMHTYYAIDDIHDAKVTGLDGVQYWDNLDHDANPTQHGDVSFTGEVDRVYHSAGPVELVERDRQIRIEKRNSADTVVWNPWIDKAKAMPDYGDDEWPQMCCIEVANCKINAVDIPAGQTQTMGMRVSVLAAEQ